MRTRFIAFGALLGEVTAVISLIMFILHQNASVVVTLIMLVAHFMIMGCFAFCAKNCNNQRAYFSVLIIATGTAVCFCLRCLLTHEAFWWYLLCMIAPALCIYGSLKTQKEKKEEKNEKNKTA